MIYAIILAGGVGSRFWPLSTDQEPKQFLNIFSKKSLLEESLDRIRKLVKADNLYIATNRAHRKKIKFLLKGLKITTQNILFEPKGKNTLAPIAALTQSIFGKDKDAVVVVMPSDHLVKERGNFIKTLKRATVTAEKGYVVTIGIIPHRPETGYGYIKIRKSGNQGIRGSVYEVEKFVEKPNPKTAKEFIKDKRYFWNAGIFVFRAKTFLEEIKRWQPKLSSVLDKIKTRKDINRLWSLFPSMSIDYGLMEKTKKVALIPADFGWIDLGSWKALEEVKIKDKCGNISCGKHVDMGSKNITVWSKDHLVATLGLKDIIIVNTGSGLLVCSKEETQDLKKLIKLAKKQ